MKPTLSTKILGTVLIVVSILGILFCLSLITATWMIKPDVQTTLTTLIQIAGDSLEATDSGILLLQSTLETSESNLNTVETSLVNLGVTIESISPSLKTTATMLGEDMTQTVVDTQTSLESAAISAEIIDDTLAVLATIPLLGADYQPDVPLHISLQQVADNLDDLPDSLETIEDSLNTTAESLNTVQGDIELLAEDINAFSEEISEAGVVLDEYARILDDLQTGLMTLETSLASYLTLLAAVLTGLFVFLLTAQVNILTNGLEYLRGDITVVKLSDLDRK